MLTANHSAPHVAQPLRIRGRHTIAIGHVVPPSVSGTSAQQAWLRLFGQPYQQGNLRLCEATPTPSIPGTVPVVGDDHDFVEPQPWPKDIVRIANNVFSASRPYPVSRKYSAYRYDCACDGDRCVAEHGERSCSSCINVNQDIVCDDSICFVGDDCGNRMQQHYALDLIATHVGLGVVCNVAIPKDAFVVEYMGEVLLGPDAHGRADKRYHVELKTKASWDGPTEVFVDAARCGNESRFINHSCAPNCGLYELEWTNTSRLGIFAKAEIPALRELTFRYTESNLSMSTCECGHPNCISKRA